MVISLPSVAISWCGNEKGPIQSAAYFGSETHKHLFSDTATKICKLCNVADEANSTKTTYIDKHDPYMVTFQSNLEDITLSNDVDLYKAFDSVPSSTSMKSTEDIVADTCKNGGNDNKLHKFEAIQEDNVRCIMAVGQKLGWFPTNSTYSTLIKNASAANLASSYASMGSIGSMGSMGNIRNNFSKRRKHYF